MKKSLLIIVFTLFLSLPVLRAQNARMNSMGGIKYALSDQDNSLNLYDFGKNPAWLINDEKENWLKIAPSYQRQWGSYRRLYDFKGSDEGGVTFRGLKPLGENGTFLGSASYNYEMRREIYRSIKRNPYDGTAFFATDTTTGNFQYDGPSVGFIYSFELLPGFFLGASVNYQVLDGLKNIYSLAKTLYRDVNGNIGLAYTLSDNCVLGADFGLFDSQESLEMKNLIGQTEVEIFNYRGDTYSTSVRKSTVNEKIRSQGKTFGSQIYFRPADNLETALKGDYTSAGTKVLLPRGQSIKEFEEGYTSFENYGFEIDARYHASGSLTLGGALGYSKDYSWSRNSERNLLLWEWNKNKTFVGLGAAYVVEPLELLLGADYEYEIIKADSSKYIDVKFHNVSSGDHLLRLGAEKRVYNDIYLRAGYNYGNKDVDFLSGGSSVALNYASLGLGFSVFGETKVDFMLLYGKTSPGNYSGISRDRFSAAATIRLNSF